MAADDRDRASLLLRSLTLWVGAIGGALLGIFAAVAAITIPGTSDATASTTTTTDVAPLATAPPAEASTPDPVQVQAPVSLPVAAPPEQPHARSGGSSHR